MARPELDPADAPVCPFLGLASDPRSHSTYPHPGHRCLARKKPAPVDAQRQTTYCLTADFPACDRYVGAAVRTPRPPDMARPDPTRGPAPKPRPAAVARTPDPVEGSPPGLRPAVIYRFRTGDSLARIAATYGVTIEAIARMNGLAPDKPVQHGTELVIPLSPAPPPSRAGRSPTVGG